MAKYVLVAEDDRDIQSLVSDVLQDAGFDVGSAVGAATISAVHERRPDLIMLDYNMPGMDGIRIARELKANPSTADIPIVAMTAAGRAPMVCREMDAQGCLGKPFDIDHLVEAVASLVHMTH